MRMIGFQKFIGFRLHGLRISLLIHRLGEFHHHVAGQQGQAIQQDISLEILLPDGSADMAGGFQGSPTRRPFLLMHTDAFCHLGISGAGGGDEQDRPAFLLHHLLGTARFSTAHPTQDQGQ
jgi:hypothetical protein